MQLSGLLKSYQPQMVSFSRPPLALALLPPFHQDSRMGQADLVLPTPLF